MVAASEQPEYLFIVSLITVLVAFESHGECVSLPAVDCRGRMPPSCLGILQLELRGVPAGCAPLATLLARVHSDRMMTARSPFIDTIGREVAGGCRPVDVRSKIVRDAFILSGSSSRLPGALKGTLPIRAQAPPGCSKFFAPCPPIPSCRVRARRKRRREAKNSVFQTPSRARRRAAR